MNIIKGVLISSFIVTIVIAILLWLNPSNGYEPSIYRSVPVIVWFLFIVNIVLSILLIIRSLYKIGSSNIIKFTSFGLLLINGVLLFSLHSIRGYNIMDLMGDSGSHVGTTYSIISSFSLPDYCPYPGMYLETITAHLISGINLDLLINNISTIFHLVFIFGIFLIAKEVSEKKGEVAFSIILAVLYVFGSSKYITQVCTGLYAPSCLALYLFPLFAYLVFKLRNIAHIKEKRNSFVILIGIFFTSLMIYHLLIGVFAITLGICILFQEILYYLYTAFINRKNKGIEFPPITEKALGRVRIKFSIIITTIISFIGIGWILISGTLKTPLQTLKAIFDNSYQFTIIESTLQPTIEPTLQPTIEPTLQPTIEPTLQSTIEPTLYSPILNERGNSWLNDFFHLLNQQPLEIFELIFKLVGIFILLCIIMIVVIPYFLRSIINKKEYVNYLSLYLFGGVLCGFALLPLFATGVFEPGRALFLFTLIGILCAGVFINLLIIKCINLKKSDKLVKSVSIGILIVCVISTFGYLGVISTYTSMETHQWPLQTTDAQLGGFSFYFEKCNLNTPLIENGSFPPFRYSLAIYHKSGISNPISSKYYVYGDYPEKVGNHFGYNDDNSTLGELYNSNHYLLLTDEALQNQIFNEEIYHHERPINNQDLSHLLFDLSVNKFYDDNDVQFYFIQ